MPEVAEVAHVCALLRRNVIGYKISKALLNHDALLFPLLKNSSDPTGDLSSLQANLVNSEITSVGRHGKYFWLRLNKEAEKGRNGVLLMHFGMTGMIKIKNVNSHLTFMENGGDKKVLKELEENKSNNKNSQGLKSKYFPIKDSPKRNQVKQEESETMTAIDVVEEKEEVEWPPRFTKFELELSNGDKILELAFVDPRRLGRVRYLSGPEVEDDKSLLNQKPLAALGPDYSKSGIVKAADPDFIYGDPDPDPHGRARLNLEDFCQLIMSKRKPIKALLLDQDCFAGVGNWVGDEVLFHAKIHPADVLSSKLPPWDQKTPVHPKICDLYHALIYVMETSISVEGNVKQFPLNWLMPFRWGKGRKKVPKVKTNDGFSVDHVTVGGRTSCYVPELQKPLRKVSGHGHTITTTNTNLSENTTTHSDSVPIHRSKKRKR